MLLKQGMLKGFPSTVAERGYYRKARMISATQPKKDEEAAVTGSPQSVGCTTVRLWFGLELDFCSFLAPQAKQLLSVLRGGQNTSIYGQMLGKKV